MTYPTRLLTALILGLSAGGAGAQPMDTVASITTLPAPVVTRAPASGVNPKTYLPGTYARTGGQATAAARSAAPRQIEPTPVVVTGGVSARSYYAEPAPNLKTVAARRDESGRLLCPRGLPMLREVTLRDGNTLLRCAAKSGAEAAGIKGSQPMVPPPGYRNTWEDGRLNPLRGSRTAQGDREMARYWTNDVPMQGKPSATEPPPLLRMAP